MTSLTFIFIVFKKVVEVFCMLFFERVLIAKEIRVFCFFSSFLKGQLIFFRKNRKRRLEFEICKERK